VEALTYVTMIHQFSPRDKTVSRVRHVENGSSCYHTGFSEDELESLKM
jgi:hypothetical protein